MVSEAAVLQALRAIRDPEAQQDIVALGLVRDVRITEADVSFTLAFTAQSPQAKATIHGMAWRLVGQLPGVSRVQVKMSGGAREEPAGPAHGAGAAHGAGPVRSAELIPEVRHTVAVSSGKGGVGKSTVAVNLAVTLSQTGGTVGIIDSDVYGPDVPLMLGARGRPGMFENRIIPVEVHGLKMMSIGLPVHERGPRVWPGTPLPAQIPLDPETRVGGDEGSPIALRRPDSPQAKVFRDLALAVRSRLDELAALKPLPKLT